MTLIQQNGQKIRDTARKHSALEKAEEAAVEQFETRLVGTGYALPERVVPNTEFEKMVDTSDEWIRKRTGIHERRFADTTDRTSDYASDAGLKALNAAGIAPAGLDAIVLATNTPDMRLPATANFVQRRIGAENAYAYDISAACSGFIFALSSAYAHIQAGFARNALVIGAEIYSSILDFQDRTTCVLFGDGAGAVVLERKKPEGADTRSGVLGVSLYSQGQYTDILQCEGSGTVGRTTLRAAEGRVIKMDGKIVFKVAIQGVTRASRDVLQKTGLDIGDVDWLIPHQANIRIIENIAQVLGCPMEKVVVNVDRVGNTSSASVPIALGEAVRDGRITKGDIVLLSAVGGGFSSGAVLLRM
ncbi:MAG: beta-ketoacyl-ACP synthase III [Verrucomicrobiota bacterium]